jgi:hypothetical protein
MLSTHVVALVYAKVCLHVPLVCSPDCPGHTWPRLLERKHTLYIVSVDLLSRDRVNDCRLDTEEGERGRSGLGRSYTTERCDDVGTGLGLPVRLYVLAFLPSESQMSFTYIHNVCFLLSNNLKVPLPNLCSNGLTH